MNTDQPYKEMNEQQDLPLPDQEVAWQKMNQMLEEEDRKKPLIPPAVLRSCAGWGLLGIALVAVLYFVQPQQWFEKTPVNVDEQLTDGHRSPGGSESTVTAPSGKNNKETVSSSSLKTGIPEEDPNAGSGTVSGPSNVPANTSSTVSGRPVSSAEFPSFNGNKNREASIKTEKTTNYNSRTETRSGTEAPHTNENSLKPQSPEQKMHSLQSDETVPLIRETELKDSVRRAGSPAVQEKVIRSHVPEHLNFPINAVCIRPARSIVDGKPIQNPITKPAAVAGRKYFITAGIGLQQQIPVFIKSDSLGEVYRKNSIADYVPSLYVRLQKEDKWFLQGEFRYGAPQSVNEFSYSKQTKFQDSSITTTTMRLKKTYYHQLPLSFNYYLRPGWSVGAGGIYSRFYRAVTEQETKSKDIQTQVEKISTQIVEVPRYTDSFFYKTQIHLLLQTDFEWRRFTVGLRYTKDVQPYIRYTEPNGKVNEERNQTLQVFLRYRLWKSKRFDL